MQKDEIQEVLCNALEEISSEKQHQEKCLWMLVVGLQSELGIKCEGHAIADAQKVPFFEKYQLIVSSVLMTSLPRHFPGICSCLFMTSSLVLSIYYAKIKLDMPMHTASIKVRVES